jgi:hypothetical protein
MKVENSIEIDRPVATVWRFFAVEHIRNHPRWDPDVRLEQVSEGPVALGTVVKRTVSRFDRVTEGSMECVRFDPEHAIQFAIQDGSMEMTGGADFVAETPERTRLTSWADIPGIDDTVAEAIKSLMHRSVVNMKELIESET